jgi:hypothetical protein
MGANVYNLIKSEWGIDTPRGSWLLLQRSDPIYDLQACGNPQEAWERRQKYNFQSSCILECASDRPFHSVGRGGIGEGWDIGWLLVWLRLPSSTLEVIIHQHWTKLWLGKKWNNLIDLQGNIHTPLAQLG